MNRNYKYLPPPPTTFTRGPLGGGRAPMTRRTLAALLLLLALAALSAAPASADSVSNISLTSNDGLSFNEDYPAAQAFTTYTSTAGYTLQSITIRVRGTDSTVTLHADSSGSPGTTLATLSTTDSSTLTFTNLTYTCSTGCGLSGGTSYHVVVTPPRLGATFWAQNSSGTEVNTPTTANWSIANNSKYRNGPGGSWLNESPTAVKLMTVSYSVNPTLTASNIGSTTARLTIANHTDAWYYMQTSPSSGTCSSEVTAGTSTADLTGLTANTSHTFKAYSDSGCTSTKELASETFTTLAVELWAENIRHGSAGLQLRNWDGGAWSYKVTGGFQPARCTIVSVGSYAFAYQLDKGTTHTATAYSGGNCDTSKQLDTETFTTLASIQNYPALSASSITSTGATLTIANHTGDWWYKESADTSGTACKKVDAGTDSATLSGLSPNTFYRYYAYSHEGCDEATVRITWITDKMDLVTSGTITATVTDISATSATLAVSGLTEGKWSYRHKHYPYGGDVYPVLSACVTLDHSTASVSVTGLKNGTAYEFLVHRGNSCDINQRIVVRAHTVSFSADSVGQSSATLKMEHYEGEWHHQQADGGAQAQSTGGAQAASSPNGCAGPITGSTANLDGLTPGTEYTWKAYKAAGCAEADAIATATFTTLKEEQATPPDPVTNIQVTHNGDSLSVTWDAPEGATHYDVTYYGNGVNARAAWNREGTSLTVRCDIRQDHLGQYCVTGGASYTVGVRARNAAGESAWRDSAKAQPPAVPEPVTNIRVTHNGSSLDVTWDASARATAYDVTYYGNSVNARAAWNRPGTSLTVRCDIRPDHLGQYCVTAASAYHVGVRARNAAGESAWRDSAKAQPPALSVADATTDEPAEGETATLDFAVTLDRAASGQVTVAYATSDGTATAGDDYTATTGTLTFAVGETSKTVAVTVLADAHDDGGETLTLTLSNASGAALGDAEATGTINNDGPIPAAWIARFGRTVADQALEAIETRMRTAPAAGSAVVLGGQQIDLASLTGADTETAPKTWSQAERFAGWLQSETGARTAQSRTVNLRDLLTGSSFALTSETAGGSLISLWGRGGVTSFDGREGAMSLDGEVVTGLLGADWTWGRGADDRGAWTAGLLLSHSAGDGDYTGAAGGSTGAVAASHVAPGSHPDRRGASSGAVEATLTGAFPWVRHALTDRVEAWGTAGYGQGELTVTPTNQAALKADLDLRMAAAGVRGTLLDGGADGLTLTGKTDARAVRTTSRRGLGGGTLEAAQATVTRLRLGLEAQRPFALGDPGPEEGAGTILTPSLELGLRHDGGDAETGYGLDLGGGLVLAAPGLGLQADVRGRGLLSHEAGGFRERGFSGSLNWQQQPGTDRGATLALTQTVGGAATGGTDALLSRTTLAGLTQTGTGTGGANDLTARRLEVQFGYGLPAFDNRYTLTPEAGAGFSETGRDYRFGLRLNRVSTDWSLEFTGAYRSTAGAPPDQRIALQLQFQFGHGGNGRPADAANDKGDAAPTAAGSRRPGRRLTVDHQASGRGQGVGGEPAAGRHP